MNRIINGALIFALAAIVIVAIHLNWLHRLRGDESYPEDEFLHSEPKKVALIVVAHDDDAIGCAGTISELTASGWQVHFLTFYGKWRREDNQQRKREVHEVVGIQRLASANLIDFSLQRSDTVRETWRPIPYQKFSEYMKVDSLRLLIATAIERLQPSVVFTLDNVIGGYGHPEHVCVSQSVIDVCRTNSQDPDFTVKKIYQAVFTPSLNENILRDNPAFIAAKKVYGAQGSPVPDVEVDISGRTAEKKAVMTAYASQQRNIRKVWPYYHIYPHWIYFKIFDKEYFHVLDVKSLQASQ